jgi:hypothetical protein
MSDTLPKTEKYPHEKLNLDGLNYSQWATGFKMWAGGLGIWSYISGEEQEPSPPAPLSDSDQNIIRNEKHAEKVKIFKQRRLLALSALSTISKTLHYLIFLISSLSSFFKIYLSIITIKQPLQTWEMPPGVGVDLPCHHSLARFAYHAFCHISQAIAAPFSPHIIPQCARF